LIIFKILLVIILTFLLTALIRQSYNLFFIILQKPFYWLLVMFFLPVITFSFGSLFKSSFNIVWWSSFLSLLVNIPHKNNLLNKHEIDEIYNDLEIKHGRLKYRLGLSLYLIAGLTCWFLFYGEIVRAN